VNAFKGDADEFVEDIAAMYSANYEMTKHEKSIYESGSLKKIKKFEKRRKSLSDWIIGLSKIFDNFEHNLQQTLSQIHFLDNRD
jgi:hypothetical protein